MQPFFHSFKIDILFFYSKLPWITGVLLMKIVFPMLFLALIVVIISSFFNYMLMKPIVINNFSYDNVHQVLSFNLNEKDRVHYELKLPKTANINDTDQLGFILIKPTTPEEIKREEDNLFNKKYGIKPTIRKSTIIQLYINGKLMYSSSNNLIVLKEIVKDVNNQETIRETIYQ